MGDSFVIRVSPNLLNQIADNEQNSKKKKKPKTRIPPHRQNVGKEAPQKPASAGVDTHKSIPNTGWPPQVPVFLPISPPPSQVANAELDAIRAVLRDSEATLDRLQKKEENKMNEVTQRAKEMRDKEFKLPHQNPMPCLAEKDACFECYGNHVKDPLKCANVVKAYADCVRKARQQVSSLG
ncbi:hypothetical protein Sjap_020498 [Stephania japonica]|uniref:Uncharacterized protein n=1 Tax=Stephania japonica TaxID=461633 RepID=A0AAP0I0Q7_9MAGN